MFESARWKLTAWYILIIALVTVLFSVAFYRASTREFDRIIQRQLYRREHPETLFFMPAEEIQRRLALDNFTIESIGESKRHLTYSLTAINLGILALAALAGYFLAGRTLNPIKEMVEEQNRFITDSSHELRTPLTSLKSEIEVNLRDNKLTLANAKKLLLSNLEEVNNLQGLSDQLIQLSQFRKTSNQTHIENTSLTFLLNEAIKKVNGIARKKGIRIKNEANDYPLTIDIASITELFVILLDNAIKYSPKGKTIKLTSSKPDHSIVIKVIDQGIGIEEKDLPKIFDRFYRADKSRTKTQVAGYGLGLSIAKQIIEKHHGSIKVQSQPGSGTIFTLTLPQIH